MSDMMADGHIPPQEILRDENRACTRKLTRMTGLILLLAFLGIALTSTQVPAFAVPVQEWVQMMAVLGLAKTLAGLGALWDGITATFGWLDVLKPVVKAVFTGIGMAIGAVIYAGFRIYELVLFISPFNGATIDGGETTPDLYRMGMLALWAPFSVIILLCMAMNRWRGKSNDIALFAVIFLTWLALGVDICGFWLFHINNVLGYEMAGFFRLIITGIVSFAVIFGVGIYWARYFDRLSDVFTKLSLRVDEPTWVFFTRIGIVVVIPLVLMAGGYLGAFYGGTFTGAAVCALLAGTAYAWCVKSTITCGYYPKSNFVVIPKSEEPMLEHASVAMLEGPASDLRSDMPWHG